MSLFRRQSLWCALAALTAPLSSASAASAALAAAPAATGGAAPSTSSPVVLSSPAVAPAQNAANAPTRGAANAQAQTGQASPPTASQLPASQPSATQPLASQSPTANANDSVSGVPLAGDNVPEPLSVDQAVSIGLARNPSLLGAAAGVASAQANYRSLKVFPNVNLGLSSVSGSSAAPTLNGTTRDTFVDLGDTFDLSGQRRFSAHGAQATYLATAAQLTETKITLEQQIRDAYWSLVAARAQTAIAHEGLADAQKINDATKLQQTAGASPRVDVLRSNIDLANAQQNLVTAQGNENSALAALNALLARTPGADLLLADTLDENGAVPIALILPPPLPQMTTQALANRPAVTAAREQVRAAEFATKQARASRFPDLSVDYERSLQNPISSVVVAANLPLFDFGSIGQSVKAARESQKQAVSQQQQAEAQVTQQVEQACRDLAQAQKLAGSYRSDILLPSQTLLNMAQLGLEQGATGILPVLDAESTLRDARNGYINSLLSLLKAQDELLAATGNAHDAGLVPADTASSASVPPTNTASPNPPTAAPSPR